MIEDIKHNKLLIFFTFSIGVNVGLFLSKLSYEDGFLIGRTIRNFIGY
mgnify:CR=1 FL=1|jgi:hypothetical protein